MGEEKKESKAGRIDGFFAQISDYISMQISRFVAFLFVVFALGAVYGALLVQRQVPWWEVWVAAPAALGLVAYYNRTFAVVIFALIVLLFVIL